MYSSCLRLAANNSLPISETLTDYFNTFGEVIGVEIKMDALTGRSRFVKAFVLYLYRVAKTSTKLNGEVH